MSSLRSIRLVLSLAMCNLGLIHCAVEAHNRPVAQGGQKAVESSVEVEGAAWKSPEAEASSEAAVAAHLASLQRAPAWEYAGDVGPSHWGDLQKEYELCKTGSMQSPIDIPRQTARPDRELELIDFGYASVPLHIWNDGRTVQVDNTTPAAINAASGTWRLLQIQLHSPSEHTFDGLHSALEVELLHSNDEGRLAVVSLLFDAGKENTALAPLFDAIPAEITDEATPVHGASIDLGALIPASPGYFTYLGSLTTPDCTEGVRWFVLEPIGQVSEEQVDKLREVTSASTSRPTQPLNGRSIHRPL